MTKPLSLILLALLSQTPHNEALESSGQHNEALDCSFQESYPRHLVTYKLGEGEEITMDGNMDEEAWQQVEWSQDFNDISTDVTPRLRTRMKIRWDDDWLYVGAFLQETQIWANITETCHCINEDQDQVIFHDNDFEIFIDVDGSNHNYKEFEVNAANATWIILLNKPYGDGGFENSSRVMGSDGFDMQPPLTSGVHIRPGEALNNPSVTGHFWSTEIALPIDKVLERSLNPDKRPGHGDYWRINFSRVQWRVLVEDDIYVKDPAFPHEDNWVWSPQGEIAMHLPERWGFLQFSEDAPGSTGPKVQDEEWSLRQVAMSLYYAEHSYASAHGARFTEEVARLVEFISYPQGNSDPGTLLGECSSPPMIQVSGDQRSFTATVSSYSGELSVTVTSDRLLTVRSLSLPEIEIV